jgi:hypothetical protein
MEQLKHLFKSHSAQRLAEERQKTMQLLSIGNSGVSSYPFECVAMQFAVEECKESTTAGDLPAPDAANH